MSGKAAVPICSLFLSIAGLLLAASPARTQEVLEYARYNGAGWESRIGTKLEVRDGIRVPIALDFNLYDRRFASAWVSEDGYLQFRDPADTSSPWGAQGFPIQEPGYGFLVAPFWSNLSPAAGGVYFNTLGTRPTRTYVVTWLDLLSSDYPDQVGPASFQVVLREGTGELELNYLRLDTTASWWIAGLNRGDGVSFADLGWEVTEGLSAGFRPTGFAHAYAREMRVRERDRVTLDGSRSYLDGEAIEAAQWDFGTDGEPSVDAAGLRVTTRYAREGVYTAALTVVGSAGTERHDEAKITVLGRAPCARIQVVASPVQYTRALVLSAAPSSDDRGIRSYRWDFGDGFQGQGSWVSHRYNAAGSFKVRLTVEDAAGQTSTATATVKVAPGTRPAGRLYAGGTEPGVVYQRDQGGGWQTVSSPLGRVVTDVVEHGGMLYASVWGWDGDLGEVWSAVYRHPAGATSDVPWEQVGQVLPYTVTALEAYKGKLYRGTDNFEDALQLLDAETDEWTTVFQTNVGVYGLKVIDDLLYVGDYDTDSVYRFDGESFSTIMSFPGSCIWDIETWNGSIFVAAFGNIHYRSDDDGATWRQVLSGDEDGDGVWWDRNMWALQTYQGRLYAGLDRGEVYPVAPGEEPDVRAALEVYDLDAGRFTPVASFPATTQREGVLDLVTDGLCLYLALGHEAEWFRFDGDAAGKGAVWEYCGGAAVDISAPEGMGQAVGSLLTGLAVDGTPPEVESFTLSPSVLPQAHRRLVEVKPSFAAADPGGGALSFRLLTINYHDFGGFDRTCYDGVEGLRCNGPAFRDIHVDSQGKIWLRAERDGRGTGRVYTVTGVVLDEAGNASEPVSATVTVPRAPPAAMPVSTARSRTTWWSWASPAPR